MHASKGPKTVEPGRRFNPRLWLLPLLIAVVSILIGMFGDDARILLRFDRGPISSGEWWRLLSGHWVHLGWSHLIVNVAGIALVWLLVGSYLKPSYWLTVLVATILGVDAGLWWLSPGLDWYVGLSGVLHGLLSAGLIGGLLKAPRESLIIAGVLLAKLVVEQWSGPLPGSETTAGGPVVVAAHLYGSIAGSLAAVPLLIRDKGRGAI